ncbi:hypothetical protein [Halorubrum amylolyticum]|uniref:hypothetical protein n=1 Tax=Halorubrum amylolyticum TaxID=2508724 RepID=UPI001F50A66B|nr:hypothetical protein [Halorubrum amylolyticum]
MRRRALLRTGAGIGAVGLAGIAGCTGGSDDSTFEEGFEGGVGDWKFGATLGPEVDVDEFDWEAPASEEEAASGERSLRIWNQGDYDDGVTWATHPVSVESGESYRIAVTVEPR